MTGPTESTLATQDRLALIEGFSALLLIGVGSGAAGPAAVFVRGYPDPDKENDGE